MELKEKTLIELLEEAIRILEKEPENIKDIEGVYKLKKRLDSAFLSFLDYLFRSGKEEVLNVRLRQIYREVSEDSVSSILQELTYIGSRLREELGDDFRKMGYRILEHIRAGKRSDVQYSITRIFITNKKNIPQKLIEAFKPRYDDDTFKAFMYAFIGSVIKPEKAEKEG